MHIILLLYLFVGYVRAFNYCRMQELRGHYIQLIDTALIAFIYCCLWLPFEIISTFIESYFLIKASFCKEKEEKLIKK